MLNYEIDPALLLPFVPKGTELDTWNDTMFASMIGFRFLDTRVLGMAIPIYRDFEEINLRFYVRRKADDGWRRGVVFVKEIVPRLAIELTARWRQRRIRKVLLDLARPNRLHCARDSR